MPRPRLVLGTRSTPLAVAQSEGVAARLRAAGCEVELRRMSSQGDRSLGGSLALAKGMFTAELDRALRRGEVDLVVHSLKDLPVLDEPGLRVVAVPPRAPANDLLVLGPRAAAEGLDTLEQVLERDDLERDAGSALAVLADGASVGTSSPRRQSGLLALRPDLLCVGLRGSVGRRLERLIEGDLHAVLLAEAGLRRLPRDAEVAARFRRLRAIRLSLASWPCAPGQGALAVQVAAGGRWEGDPALLALDDPATRRAVGFERGLLERLGGGCQMPFGAAYDGGRISAVLAAADWRRQAAAGERPRHARWSYTIEDAAGSDQGDQGQGDQGDQFDQLIARAAAALSSGLATGGGGEADGGSSAGPSLVITSEPTAAARLARLLPAEATVAPFPCTEPQVLDRAWPVGRIDLDRSRRHWPWVLVSSPTAGRVLVERCSQEPVWGRLPWCALGEGTARTLLGLGVPPSLVAGARDGGELAELVLGRIGADSVLFVPHSERSKGELVRRLRTAGRAVVAWPAYTVRERAGLRWPGSWPETPSTMLFTAPSHVHAFSASGLEWPTACWALGEPTARALAERLPASDGGDGSRPPIAVAPSPTAEGVLDLWRRAAGADGSGRGREPSA